MAKLRITNNWEGKLKHIENKSESKMKKFLLLRSKSFELGPGPTQYDVLLKGWNANLMEL